MSLTDKAALKTWRFEQGAGFPFAPPVIEVTSAAGNGPALGSPSARSLLPFKTVPRRGTLFERTDLCQHRAPLRSPFGEPPPPKGEEEGRLTAAFRGSAGLPSGSAETAFVRAKHPTGVYLRGTRVQGISLLLSFSIAKRKKQSLSALRAAYGGCAPRRAFCEADVPEGARSDPSGLGAEMLPSEKERGSFALCGGRPEALPLDSTTF